MTLCDVESGYQHSETEYSPRSSRRSSAAASSPDQDEEEVQPLGGGGEVETKFDLLWTVGEKVLYPVAGERGDVKVQQFGGENVQDDCIKR